MHELSIAQSIIDIAARHAGGARVTAVHVRVGRLRQVVPDALAFAFELCAHGTVAEGAELELEEVAVLADCRACRARSEQDGLPLACPRCGGLAMDVVAGEELVVDELETEQPQMTTTGGTR
jgi:hydrogenase nickel incorporation protein HypA/HybF